MNNLDDTLYHGAANSGTSSQTGGANWRPLPLPAGKRLGDEGVDFVEWFRETKQEAQIRGLWPHLSQAATADVTQIDFGGQNTFKNRLEILNINKRTEQERITACEFLRCRVAPHSEEIGLILTAIDTHQPFEAMNLLIMQCDKKDYGKLVQRVNKLFLPSLETSTGGVVNETRRLLNDICAIGIKLSHIQGRVEDGEEKGNEEDLVEFAFPPCIVTAVALSRSMVNQPKDKEHHAKGAKMVKEITFRHPNRRADEIGYAEFHEVLRVINQTEAMLKPDKAVNVFEFTSFAPRPPAKARSATAKPEDKCELHPYAKIPHTNGECRQNAANPKFKLKFNKRDRAEGADQKMSHPKNDPSQKVLFIEEEDSDIEEIYCVTQTKNFHCDTNNMLGVGCFTPNKNLRIQIPRQAEATVTQLEDCWPLTYDSLMEWHEKDRKDPKVRHFLESSEEEQCSSSSECISVDSGELFRETGIERWPPKPNASDHRLLGRDEDGGYGDMLSPHVEPATVITDDENYFRNMAYLTDYPREFKWYDEHELLPDGGWKVVHEEEQEEMSSAASPSENEHDSI